MPDASAPDAPTQDSPPHNTRRQQLDGQLADYLALIEKAIDRHLPPATTRPTRLHEAMRHSMQAGGKRLRPVLLLAAARLRGSALHDPLPAAVALECLHTYSLIHDDLPCMDNDDLRRGRPSCHRAFDEATALLAGDALLTHAFELLSSHYPAEPDLTRTLIRELAAAGSSTRLIGGQMEDLLAEKHPATATAASTTTALAATPAAAVSSTATPAATSPDAPPAAPATVVTAPAAAFDAPPATTPAATTVSPAPAATAAVSPVTTLADATPPATAPDATALAATPAAPHDTAFASAADAQLEYIPLHKTAALLEAALVMGGHCSGLLANDEIETLRALGRELGLAYQIVDDLLDATADTATLGKTAGKDARAGKVTTVTRHGLEPARQRAAARTQAALDTLRRLPGDTTFLHALVEHLLTRQN